MAKGLMYIDNIRVEFDEEPTVMVEDRRRCRMSRLDICKMAGMIKDVVFDGGVCAGKRQTQHDCQYEHDDQLFH